MNESTPTWRAFSSFGGNLRSLYVPLRIDFLISVFVRPLGLREIGLRRLPMLSRRALLAGGVSSLAAPAILARAQSSTDTAAAAPTILRLERRDIEVNGKTASVYGIRQP